MPNGFLHKSAWLHFFFYFCLNVGTASGSVVEVPAGTHRSLDGEIYENEEFDVTEDPSAHGGVLYVAPAQQDKASGVLDSLCDAAF